MMDHTGRQNPNDSMNDRQLRNPLRTVIWSIAAIALLTPWVAMQFTDEVVWSGMAVKSATAK